MQFEVHKSNYHTLLLLGLEYQMFLATISAAYLSKSKSCHFLREKKVQSKKKTRPYVSLYLFPLAYLIFSTNIIYIKRPWTGKSFNYACSTSFITESIELLSSSAYDSHVRVRVQFQWSYAVTYLGVTKTS